jgi:hypothetical protein
MDRDGGRGGAFEQRHDVSKYLGSGYFRDAFLVTELRGGGGGGDPANSTTAAVLGALKTNRLWERRGFNNYAYAQTQMEALALLQTSSSNRTVDLYGHCGVSVIVEPCESIVVAVSPYERWDPLPDVQEIQRESGRLPVNRYAPEQKLDIAIAMAESIAELHGNSEGVIINHDLGLDQFLVSKVDGMFKMSDMNKARVLYWNPTEGQYCKVWSAQNGIRRDPEEMGGGYVDESADVFTFGMILYTIVTGLRPYYDLPTYKEAIRASQEGRPPYVDPRYRSTGSNFIERRLVEVMELCYVRQPERRASIFDVVAHLHETSRYAAAGNSPTNSAIGHAPIDT